MGEITLRKALDDYRMVHMPYRNFAQRTRVEYQNDLEQFVEFLERSGINHTKEINLPITERYVARLEQQGFASLTRKRKVVTIRSFVGFLFQDGYIDTAISKKVILPFTETNTPQILTKTECDRIREACYGNPRDKAIFELLLQTGIKLSELTHLTLDDLELEDYGNSFARIKGSRGRKERIIPLDRNACIALKSYLHEREDSESNITFLNRFGQFNSYKEIQEKTMFNGSSFLFREIKRTGSNLSAGFSLPCA